MRALRFTFCFLAIGGIVLLLHDDASAGPSAPSTQTAVTPVVPLTTTAALAGTSGATSVGEESGSRRGFLGVGVTSMSRQLRETFEVPEGVGVLIDEIEPGSPAEAAKLRAGDVIVSFDGEDIESGSQLARAIRAAGADSTVALGFYRNGRYRQEAVTLAASEGASGSWTASNPRSDWDEDDWEAWGESFGERMAEQFEAMGEQWAEHGEQWGEHGEEWGEQWAEFGERWGEWGERFGEQWGTWGEEFGERMAEWGERFGERFAEMGERFEHHDFDERDWEEVGREVERALEEIDWEQFEADIERSMEEIDWDQINAEIERSLDDVDWDQMNAHINGAIRSALRSLEEAGVLVERSEE